MSLVKTIEEDSQFDVELTNAGSKLVVVDFFATWCGPCIGIAKKYEELSEAYKNVVFLKVDVDICQGTASKEGVTAMPTFKFYKNKTKVDIQRGADPVQLEEKIKQRMGNAEEGEDDTVVKGHMDLAAFISKSGCECLNEADDHPLVHAFTTKGGYLESDCDEQLIINVEFNQSVKLHSLKIYGPAENGPKTVKIFQNLPNTLDFDKAENMEPTQTLELTPEDVMEGTLINLRYVKYQNVQSITIFVKDNLGGADTTQINYLGFVGSTAASTNMSDFKRVAGKKGESH
ncbi:thioredoxin-like protein 1 [Mizuhopecten yessoensis]|uniref:Thioredoxin-like protein 1 n=1 Tax=Mizuhopecten yessoensis TaxID=6573 RepID=A0A210PY01_MIZYE|nr:thioredoxin-like protein 1 [Mizuhopecten yessoensis]OWF41354.1 Thioredoxin-like protein 1 [Mizuhopecten yessoensis]